MRRLSRPRSCGATGSVRANRPAPCDHLLPFSPPAPAPTHTHQAAPAMTLGCQPLDGNHAWSVAEPHAAQPHGARGTRPCVGERERRSTSGIRYVCGIDLVSIPQHAAKYFILSRVRCPPFPPHPHTSTPRYRIPHTHTGYQRPSAPLTQSHATSGRGRSETFLTSDGDCSVGDGPRVGSLFVKVEDAAGRGARQPFALAFLQTQGRSQTPPIPGRAHGNKSGHTISMTHR